MTGSRPTLLVALLLGTAVSGAAEIDCLATDAALAYWRPVREQAQSTESPADELAFELVSCLGSPNPELRDRIGYELFTYWLRQEKVSDDTRRHLLHKLSANLTDDSPLLRSFSALILAEIMRSDANNPFMTDTERQTLLQAAVQVLATEDDFRGLEDDIGWVHPVAHMADLLWRFALHPATTAEQAENALEAVRSKVAPTEVSYSFNEGDRLARVVTTVIHNELIDAETLANWVGSFETPQSMEKWSDAFRSSEGMAELHNTKQFLRALSDQLSGAEIDPRITELLEELVQEFTQLI